MFIKDITLVHRVFTAATDAFLASVRALAVCWSFLALQGGCRKGSFGVVAQVNVIPEHLGDLEPVWDLLLEIGCWGHHALRFDYE
jgi:hypothetical protein